MTIFKVIRCRTTVAQSQHRNDTKTGWR